MSWDQLKDLFNLHENISRVLKKNLDGTGSNTGAYLPLSDVYETQENLIISIELPGLSVNDVLVTVQNNMLIVKGVKKSPSFSEFDCYQQLERNFNTFNRVFSIPTFIDTNNVDARLKEGILTIVLNKKPIKQQNIIKIYKG